MRVSVVLITYNHARFIRQALDSVLDQKTDFDYEVIVSEDCSTDDTRPILFEYQQRFPDKIRLLLSQKNQNDNEVLTRAIDAARGDYIALLDGDDYWTSSQKLQKQVDFLEANRHCAICFHNVQVIYETESKSPHPFHLENSAEKISAGIPKTVSTLADLVRTNFMATCSVMFRARLFDDFPSWFREFPFGDWPLHILNAEHGDIGYIDEIMGVYRIHSGGVWAATMSRYREYDDLKTVIDALHTFNRHLDYRFDRLIRGELTTLYYRAANLLSNAGRFSEARSHLWRGIALAAPFFRTNEALAMWGVIASYIKQPLRRVTQRMSETTVNTRE